MKKILITLIGAIPLLANNITSDFSFQGYTGLINTPNAQVITEGNGIIHFNNQYDNHLRKYNYDTEKPSSRDYIIGVGILPNFEVAGRNSNEDNSINMKYKIPLENKLLPDIALGYQDIAGSSNNYANAYLVIDKEFGIIKPSLGVGYSFNDIDSKRMDGFFFGFEIKVYEGLSILMENDSQENHVGARINLPLWENRVSLSSTISQNLTDSATSFGFSLKIPLYKISNDNTLIKDKK